MAPHKQILDFPIRKEKEYNKENIRVMTHEDSYGNTADISRFGQLYKSCTKMYRSHNNRPIPILQSHPSKLQTISKHPLCPPKLTQIQIQIQNPTLPISTVSPPSL